MEKKRKKGNQTKQNCKKIIQVPSYMAKSTKNVNWSGNKLT